MRCNSTERRLDEYLYNEVDVKVVEYLRGLTLVNRGHVCDEQRRGGQRCMVSAADKVP